jgi:RHS repeat-associated protein
VKRHDYFPFGEEIPADGSWRTTARGYVGDTVRQKFTGYERDSETNMDFAQARYYENQQGRFSSTDPLAASGRPGNPQTWNRYSYTLNNPLRFTDPVGTVEGDTQQQQSQPQPAPQQTPPPQPEPTPVATQSATLENAPTSGGPLPTKVIVDQMNKPGANVRNVKGTESLVVGVDLRFTFLDEKGNPVTNATVVEEVVDSSGQQVTQTTEPTPLDANGRGADLVSNPSGPVPKDQNSQQAAVDHFNKDFTTEQTLKLTVTTSTGRVVQVTQKRTLTNTTPGAPKIAGGRIRGYTFTMEKPKIEAIK